jgi:hypothetical protein
VKHNRENDRSPYNCCTLPLAAHLNNVGHV